MKDYLQKSWRFWVWIILEILGYKLIGRETSIYPFFTMGIVAIFELYILLKLPYSEKLWIYEESANNSKCVIARRCGFIPILALSYFSRTTLWYFIFYYATLEGAVFYFAGTEEERNKVRADIFDKMKGIIIGAIVLTAILVSYAYMHSKWMHDQVDKISVSHRSASLLR